MSKTLFILSLLLLTACTDSEPPAAKTEPVFQGQIDSLNKAKAVEGMLLDADKQRRATIDSQSN